MTAEYGHLKRNKSGNTILVLASFFLFYLFWGFGVACYVGAEAGKLFNFHPALGNPINILGYITYNPFSMFSWPPEVWHYAGMKKLLI